MAHRFEGAAVKFGLAHRGIAGKMPKQKKAHKKARKPLDRSTAKLVSRGQKSRQTGVFSGEEIFGWPLFAGPLSPPEIERESPKKGRPTMGNNILLGGRNSLLSIFEENWPLIGFSLRRVRKQKDGTIEDVQAAFEPLTERSDARLFAEMVMRSLPEAVTAGTLRANRVRNNRLLHEIQEMERQRSQLVISCAEANSVLTETNEQGHEHEVEIIQQQAHIRNDRLLEFDARLSAARAESQELSGKVARQETYWYCSQLLDFLCGKRQPAVNPLNLANALAGLPEMGWRESDDRCSTLPEDVCVRFPYGVFELVSGIWRRRPRDVPDPPTIFFEKQIRQLSKKDHLRQRLCDAWRDLRLAIERCSTEQYGEEFMPYAITLAFIRNHLSQKTPKEQMLTEGERLSP